MLAPSYIHSECLSSVYLVNSQTRRSRPLEGIFNVPGGRDGFLRFRNLLFVIADLSLLHSSAFPRSPSRRFQPPHRPPRQILETGTILRPGIAFTLFRIAFPNSNPR